MILPLTRQNIVGANYSVQWNGNDVLVSHFLNSDVICQCYDDSMNLFHLDAEKIDSNSVKLNFVNILPLGVTYRLLINAVSSFPLTDANQSIGDIANTWDGDSVVISHNIGGEVFVQIWNNLNYLVHLPVFKIDDYAFRIDFSNVQKPTGAGSWQIAFRPTESISVASIDGSDGDFTWGWSGYDLTITHSLGTYPFVQIYDGTDELVGWEARSLGEGSLRLYFDENTKPGTGYEYNILIGYSDAEEEPGTYYYASGTSQYNPITEEVNNALIPAYGDWRQYFMMSEQEDTLGNGILYQFQVATDYNFVFKVYDIVQESNIITGNPSYQHGDLINKGNIFFIPENSNLPRRSQYYWRVRYSNKRIVGETMVWFDWSKKFPFFVNKIPMIPTEVAINSRE